LHFVCVYRWKEHICNQDIFSHIRKVGVASYS
jgi:hypothetical protein